MLNDKFLKILIPTSVKPPMKDGMAIFVDSILPYLKKRYKIQIIWLLYQPDKIKTVQTEDFQIYNIGDFKNASDLLQNLKPDCIILKQTFEPINQSISLSANFLKIPLVCLYLYDFKWINSFRNERKNQRLKSLVPLLRQLFSSKMPADQEYERKFMKRWRFMMYKYSFLLNTKRSLGISLLDTMKFMIRDVIMFVSNTFPEYNRLTNLNVLINGSWFKPLIDLGFKKDALSITGNPFWDKIYEKIQTRSLDYIPLKNKINILLLTDSMVEHGLWSSSYRDIFLNGLISELRKLDNSSFSVKIHPSSENMSYYEELLRKANINVMIYQQENLWDIINNFDVVVSYGTSTAHMELIFGGVKLVILDILNESKFVSYSLVQEGIKSGHVLICKNFTDLGPCIQTLLNQQVKLTEAILKEREELFFQFAGKSSELAANEIIKLMESKNLSS